LFFVRLYEYTGDQQYLDLAAAALRHDLGRCVTGPDDTVQVDDVWRVLPYLDVGSIGIGMVLHEFLAHRADEDFLAARHGIRLAAEPELVIQSGLFNGRAGLMLYLSHVGDVGKPALDRHLRR